METNTTTQHTDAINEFMEKQKRLIIEHFRNSGSVFPFCALFSWCPDGYDESVLVIPPQLVKGDMQKDVLTAVIIPGFCDQKRREGYTVLCIAYGAEAWIRHWDNDKGPIPENYREVVKPVGHIMLKVETDTIDKAFMWEIEGDTDEATDISLEQRAQAKLTFKEDITGEMSGGRFANMFGNKKTEEI